MWLDFSDPQQQLPGGEPFQQFAVKFQIASEVVAAILRPNWKALTQSFSFVQLTLHVLLTTAS